MRQVLPTKPLASAIRYGPGLAGHWKYLVLASQGLKQPGFSPGPFTTTGPAARAAEDATNAATAATKPMRELIAVSLMELPPPRPATGRKLHRAPRVPPCRGGSMLKRPHDPLHHGRRHGAYPCRRLGRWLNPPVRR